MNEPRCPGCLADAEVRDHMAFLRAAAAHLRATAPKQLVGQVSSSARWHSRQSLRMERVFRPCSPAAARAQNLCRSVRRSAQAA